MPRAGYIPGVGPTGYVPSVPGTLGCRDMRALRWLLLASILLLTIYQLRLAGLPTVPPCDNAHTCVLVDGSSLTPMSPVMWGVSYEDINHAGEGGFYVEMLRDRSFEARAYLMKHPDTVAATKEPAKGSRAPPPARGSSRLQSASMDPTTVASTKLKDLQAWQFSNNLLASMHAVSDPPGLHACCVRIEGAEQDPEAVGQIVNTGHGLEGIPVHAGRAYRLRLRVQGVVEDLEVVLTSSDGSVTLASLRFPTIVQQPLAARRRAIITEEGLASHGSQLAPHKADSKPRDVHLAGKKEVDEEMSTVAKHHRHLLEADNEGGNGVAVAMPSSAAMTKGMAAGLTAAAAPTSKLDFGSSLKEKQSQGTFLAEGLQLQLRLSPRMHQQQQHQQQLQQHPQQGRQQQQQQQQQQQGRQQQQQQQQRQQQQQPQLQQAQAKFSSSAQNQPNLLLQQAARALQQATTDHQTQHQLQQPRIQLHAQQGQQQQVPIKQQALLQKLDAQAAAAQQQAQQQPQQQQAQQQHQQAQQRVQQGVQQQVQQQPGQEVPRQQALQQAQQKQLTHALAQPANAQRLHNIKNKAPNPELLQQQVRELERKQQLILQESWQQAQQQRRKEEEMQRQLEQKRAMVWEQIRRKEAEQKQEQEELKQSLDKEEGETKQQVQELKHRQDLQHLEEEHKLHHKQQQLETGDDVGSDSLGGIWHELVGIMAPTLSTKYAKLAIRFTGAGYLCIELASLMPEDAYTHQKSEDGTKVANLGQQEEQDKQIRFLDKPYPFNRYMIEAIRELQPQFLRFPGGAFVEGVDLDTAYRWKVGVGPPDRRPGHPNANWGYWSTDGLGLFEFMQLAEELETEPVWVTNVGISQSESTDPDELISDGWLQDTLDALDFIMNDNIHENKWAQLRASLGRDQPWALNYITLGNEDCLRPWYAQHYDRVASAIRARYPHMKLIANCDLGPNYEYTAWEFHSYRDPDHTHELTKLINEYEGRPVAVTEFAAVTDAETVQGAIAEASIMAAMERKCDRFSLGAFAPLFRHLKTRSWRPSLVVYSADGGWYGIPSFEVQKLFMHAAGAYCAKTDLAGSVGTPIEASTTCKDDLCSSSATKLVNYSPRGTHVRVRFKPRSLSTVLDHFTPGMIHHPRVAKLPYWELASQDAAHDSNSFFKPQALAPQRKFSLLRSIGRGWRESDIFLPPFSVVMIEVTDVVMA